MTDALAALGWSDRWLALFTTAVEDRGGAPARPGRVVRHDGVALLVADQEGTTSRPVLGSVEPAPVVGDWVVVDEASGAVVAVLERTSLLRRQDPDGATEQPLVANLDVLLVICGLDRPVKDGRIQRSAALAWDAGATPVVVLTKADLVTDEEAAGVADAVRAANPGLDVLVTSATERSGLDELRTLAAGRTIVLLGESGAGKSTLTNALVGDDVAAVGEVRRGDAKGRHTTTRRELVPLPGGGVLIDTPGLRGLGLWDADEGVALAFADIDELSTSCKFRDCAHQSEPGCAVKEAIESGELDARRLDSYRRLIAEMDELARRQEEQDRQRGRGRRRPRPSPEDDGHQATRGRQ